MSRAREPLVIGIRYLGERVPVRGAHRKPYTGKFLNACSARRVIEMVVGEDDVLDVRRIETERSEFLSSGLLLIRTFQRCRSG
jgi:hypothetical protein